MSFEQLETSRARGTPIELFTFRYGQGVNEFYAFTDHERAVIFDGVTFEPTAISRAAFVSQGNLDRQSLDVRLPHDSRVARLFRAWPPSSVVNLIIRQGHFDDETGDFLVIWSGRVLSASFERFECKLTCEPVQTSMKRAGLRRNYQYGCPHVLYGSECRANAVAATRTPIVISASGSTIVLDPPSWVSGGEQDHFVNGFLRWQSNTGVEIRTIIAVNGNVLTVAGTSPDLDPGTQIEAVKGCRHTMSDCADVHDNIHNFGGYPWIPTKSPLKINPYW